MKQLKQMPEPPPAPVVDLRPRYRYWQSAPATVTVLLSSIAPAIPEAKRRKGFNGNKVVNLPAAEIFSSNVPRIPLSRLAELVPDQVEPGPEVIRLPVAPLAEAYTLAQHVEEIVPEAPVVGPILAPQAIAIPDTEPLPEPPLSSTVPVDPESIAEIAPVPSAPKPLAIPRLASGASLPEVRIPRIAARPPMTEPKPPTEAIAREVEMPVVPPPPPPPPVAPVPVAVPPPPASSIPKAGHKRTGLITGLPIFRRRFPQPQVDTPPPPPPPAPVEVESFEQSLPEEPVAPVEPAEVYAIPAVEEPAACEQPVKPAFEAIPEPVVEAFVEPLPEPEMVAPEPIAFHEPEAEIPPPPPAPVEPLQPAVQVLETVHVAERPDAPEIPEQDGLQALFLTEEKLSVDRVIELCGELPGINSCVLAHGSLVVAAHNVPANVDLVSLSAHAAEMLRAMRESSARMGVGTVPAVTLHSEKGVISFFHRDDLTMLVFHKDRGFIPGVREKMAAVLGELTKVRLTLPAGEDAGS